MKAGNDCPTTGTTLATKGRYFKSFIVTGKAHSRRVSETSTPYHENGSEIRPILVELLVWAEESLPPLLALLDTPT
jgi:hypothetical protein